MKSPLRFFILILACLSSAFAGQFPARTLLIYSAPQISYPEIYEVSAKVAENRFQITFLLSNGHSIQREKAGILAMLSYPPEVIFPDMGQGATSALQQIDPLIQKYPKFTKELEALRTKWQNVLAVAMQMKAARPKPTPAAEIFSFTTKGGKFENVQITNIGADSFSVMTDSGVASIPFTDLPENLAGIPGAVKTVIINKRTEVLRIAKEAEEKKSVEGSVAQNPLDKLNSPIDPLPTAKSNNSAERNKPSEKNQATSKLDGKNTPHIPGHNTVGSTGSDSSTESKAMPPKSVEDILVGANSHYSISGIVLFFAKDGRFTLTIRKPQPLNVIERGTWAATGSNTFQIRLRKDFDESKAALFLAQLGILSQEGLIDGETGVGFVGYDFSLGKHDGTLLRRFGRTNADPDDVNSFL